MSVFRVNKDKNYTVISNYHFRDKRLSLKAKGLLSQMLSLPQDWDYTVAGLVSINKESKSAIQAALAELEQNGYLVRTKTQNEKGQFDYIYDIYEKPGHGKPRTENPSTDNPCTGNVPQLNTYKQNTEKLNKENKNKSASRFTPPTLKDVKAYCYNRNSSVDPETFMDYYISVGWKISGKPMKDWKAAVRTWERRDAKSSAKRPLSAKDNLDDWAEWENSEEHKRKEEEHLKKLYPELYAKGAFKRSK